ncbi:AI-2E family transporter [Nocardioides sediminis]|uniref:AI-2E family transporter n=1 Tax=Nocardioides sediminis TaxID=433648 RepID=UPI001900BEE3|nr:AI-2E family transporter [Nocardioides sediminis]
MTLSRNVTVLMATAAMVVVVAGLRSASDIVGPVVLALALTIVFHPLRRGLERRMPGWAASVVLLVCVYAVILGLALSLLVSAGRLAALVAEYASEADDLVANVTGWLADRGVGSDQTDAVAGSLDASQLADTVTSLLAGFGALLSNFFFLVTLLFFLTFDAAQVPRLVDHVRDHRPELVTALSSYASGTRTYLGVSAVFGLIVAVIDTVLLWAMGVPGAFVWGVLAFVTNFIPNIGFVIGLVPPAIIALLEGGPGLALAVVVVYCLVNVVIQSFIQPRYVGNAVGLSTTLTFLSLVFWTWVLGPLGALLAVPMSLLAKALLVEADPATRWMEPLVSGHPDEHPDARPVEVQPGQAAPGTEPTAAGTEHAADPEPRSP